MRTEVAMKRKNVDEVSKDNSPLRIILGNLSGRQLRVLFWQGKKDEFEGKLFNQVLKISRCQVVKANPRFLKPSENLMPIELSVQQYTKVEMLGPWYEDVEVELKVIKNLSEASTLIGETINIQCFVKTPFELILKGTSSYGSGAITDGSFRLPVNITNYEMGNQNYEIGKNVSVKGKVRTNEHGTIIIQVQKISDIEICSPATLSSSEVKMGFRAVKNAGAENRGN